MPAMPPTAEYCQLWVDDKDTKKGVVDALGLTKREHFAGLAMQGFIAAGGAGMPNASELSGLAVKYADSLLAELDKSQ